ncbi:hypothetical protein OPV22_019119 [Ensete ventricosum]|nr:hypothetical protein OPV22_019119 [Ensete ventricosum]
MNGFLRTHGCVLPLQTSVACMIVDKEKAEPEQGVSPSCSLTTVLAMLCALCRRTLGLGGHYIKLRPAVVRGVARSGHGGELQPKALSLFRVDVVFPLELQVPSSRSNTAADCVSRELECEEMGRRRDA